MLASVIGAPRRGAYPTRSRVSCSQDSLPAQFRPARQLATQTDRRLQGVLGGHVLVSIFDFHVAVSFLTYASKRAR